MSVHVCHASGCDVPVQPRMLMCGKHWFMVPKVDRDLVWALYVPGQERRKDPSPEYVAEVQRMIDELAEKEGVS